MAFAHTIQKWLSRMVDKMKGKKTIELNPEQTGELETLHRPVEQAGVRE
jgi:hypothetical protein